MEYERRSESQVRKGRGLQPASSNFTKLGAEMIYSDTKWRRRESNENLICGNELQDNDLPIGDPSVSANVSRTGGPGGQNLSLADTNLLRLIKAWWNLPPHIQQAIVTLLDAAT